MGSGKCRVKTPYMKHSLNQSHCCGHCDTLINASIKVGEMEKEIQPIKEGIRTEEENAEKFVQKLEECQVCVF